MFISPYMVFLAIFTVYWNWGTTIVVHSFTFIINESLQASSIIGVLQNYWSLFYLVYFLFTLFQVYLIQRYIKTKTKLFQMIVV